MSEQRAHQNLICELISAAVLAGAYWALARELPAASPGLLKMGRKHDARVSELVAQVREAQ